MNGFSQSIHEKNQSAYKINCDVEINKETIIILSAMYIHILHNFKRLKNVLSILVVEIALSLVWELNDRAYFRLTFERVMLGSYEFCRKEN